MDKKILIERNRSVSPLVYTESIATEGGSKKLGHLAGIGADLNNATRNGRKYPLELWQRVMQSEDFKEGMETHTLFAENDHPSEESGRIDTSIKEVAAVLTNMEIREDEGIVFVEFDILDTPQGRITKSLVDYGCVLGVSSRGLGEEIVRDGETIIDPETYSFYGFDIVVQPAVKSARPTATESLNKKQYSVIESFKREIENAKSADEVESIRRVAESSKLPNMDIINEAIETKLKSGSNDEDNIYIKKLESKVTELTSELAKTRKMLKRVSESAVANDIRVKKTNEQLNRTLKESKSKDEKLRSLQKESLRSKYESTKEMDKSASQEETLKKLTRVSERNEKKYNEEHILNEKFQNEIEKLNREIATLQQRIEQLSKDSARSEEHNKCALDRKQAVNEGLRNKNTELSKEVERLNRELNNSNERLAASNEKLTRANERLAEARVTIAENNKSAKSNAEKSKLNESKIRENADRKIKETNKQLEEAVEKYLATKCATEGIEIGYLKNNLPKNYTIEDIDKKVSEIANRRKKFNDFPIAIGNIKTGTVNLSESLNVSQEDLQTLKLLTGFQK